MAVTPAVGAVGFNAQETRDDSGEEQDNCRPYWLRALAALPMLAEDVAWESSALKTAMLGRAQNCKMVRMPPLNLTMMRCSEPA